MIDATGRKRDTNIVHAIWNAISRKSEVPVTKREAKSSHSGSAAIARTKTTHENLRNRRGGL